MKNEILLKIIRELFAYVGVVDLRGWGESALDDRLLPMIDFCNSLGIRVRIYTNLVARDEKFWFEVGKRHIDVGISVDAATPKLYEKIRRGASFKKFLRNLKALSEARIKYNVNSETFFNAIISDDNINEIPKLVILASKFSIKTVRLNPITLPQENIRYPRIGVSPDMIRELKQALKRAQKLANNLGISLELGANLAPARQGGFDLCIRPWMFTFIRYDGKVGFCDHQVANDFSLLGDITTNSFREIWNNDAYRQLRNEHIRRNFKRLRELGIECDWCYYNRYADFEYLFVESYKPLRINDLSIDESFTTEQH